MYQIKIEFESKVNPKPIGIIIHKINTSQLVARLTIKQIKDIVEQWDRIEQFYLDNTSD